MNDDFPYYMSDHEYFNILLLFYISFCFFFLCNVHWNAFNISGPRAVSQDWGQEGGPANIPFTFHFQKHTAHPDLCMFNIF